MNQKTVKITALSVEELAQLLSQAGRKAISGQDVLAIAEAAGIVWKGRIISEHPNNFSTIY
jgi:hypothetical protein